METLLLPTDTPESLARAVGESRALLQSGEIVALPTETVYGLAGDALNPAAAAKIFEAKERPAFDPLIVHLPELEWLERLAAIPAADRPLVASLTERFWPGPLTLILPRRSIVPDIVTSGLPSVALRMSAHPVFRAVAQACQRPLAAPSANRFGRISPTAARHVMSELAGRIRLVVDGGPALHGVESTIVAIAKGRIKVLRPGPVTREMLAEFGEVTGEGSRGDAQALAEAGEPTGESARPAAPGQLKSHYAPRTPLVIVEPGQPLPNLAGMRCGLLAWGGSKAAAASGESGKFEMVESLSDSGEMREAATRLFAAMRRLDEAGLDLIAAEAVPESGLGAAIMDRLRKAQHGGGFSR